MALNLSRFSPGFADQQPVAPIIAEPLHHVPPGPRELRAHAVHRLQLGLIGLTAMLLLIGLANIIMDRAREAEAVATTPQGTTASVEASQTTASDPLADIGVVPDMPASATPADKQHRAPTR